MISAGEPLAAQDRSSGNINSYYETENNDQLIDIDDDNLTDTEGSLDYENTVLYVEI